MKDLKRLPDAELEVMQAIWSLEPPVTARRCSSRSAATGRPRAF